MCGTDSLVVARRLSSCKVGFEGSTACDLSSLIRDEPPCPLHLEGRILNRWTTREILTHVVLPDVITNPEGCPGVGSWETHRREGEAWLGGAETRLSWGAGWFR